MVPVVPVVPPFPLSPLDDSAAAPAITAAPMPRAVVVVTPPTTPVLSVKGVSVLVATGAFEAEDGAGGSAAKAEALKASISAEASSFVMEDSS